MDTEDNWEDLSISLLNEKENFHFELRIFSCCTIANQMKQIPSWSNLSMELDVLTTGPHNLPHSTTSDLSLSVHGTKKCKSIQSRSIYSRG